ncbi:MAG: hypothetical protein HC892_03035 [Saprospiraceae bacterium]|nr:hypothetical protein [Saprospiraceae bacterium]
MTNFYQITLTTFSLLGLLFWNVETFAQRTVNMEDDNGKTISSCNATFYDSGGPNGRYENQENYRITFCPDNANNAGKTVRLTFNVLALGLSDRLTFL